MFINKIMSILPLIYAPHPIFKMKAEPVEDINDDINDNYNIELKINLKNRIVIFFKI